VHQASVNLFNDIPKGPFIDAPVKIPKEHYEEAVALLISKWSSLKTSPIAIYQIGQVAAPGISDLDFVIVFPSGSCIDWREYQPDVFPLWVRQMLTHPPYCCTEETWPKLPAWFPIFNMRHLYGQVLPDPTVPSEFLPGCSLGMLTDYLIVKVPRDFVWISCERPLRLRVLLALLHSLKYTFNLAESAGVDSPKDKAQIVWEVDALRKNWFELDAKERLQTLAQLCARICYISGELIQNLNDKIMIGQKGDVGTLYKPLKKSNQFLFDTSWTYESAINESIKTYKQTGKNAWINPESFLHVLGIYSNELPHFKKYFANYGYKLRFSWDGGSWNNGLRYHARAMIAYSESAAMLGVPPQKYVALGYFPQPPMWKSCLNYINPIINRVYGSV
jgi:hypothetical protein